MLLPQLRATVGRKRQLGGAGSIDALLRQAHGAAQLGELLGVARGGLVRLLLLILMRGALALLLLLLCWLLLLLPLHQLLPPCRDQRLDLVVVLVAAVLELVAVSR